MSVGPVKTNLSNSTTLFNSSLIPHEAKNSFTQYIASASQHKNSPRSFDDISAQEISTRPGWVFDYMTGNPDTKILTKDKFEMARFNASWRANFAALRSSLEFALNNEDNATDKMNENSEKVEAMSQIWNTVRKNIRQSDQRLSNSSYHHLLPQRGMKN